MQLSLFEINLLIGKHCCFQTPKLAWGTCSYKCPDGYHYEGTEDIGRFCKICPPTCVTCLGALVDFLKLLLLFSVLLLSLCLELRMFDTFLELDIPSLCSFLLDGDCMVLSYIVAGRSIWGQGQCNLCQNYTYLTPDQTCRALSGFWWGNELKFQTK